MTLKAALLKQGNTSSEVETIIYEMATSVAEGNDPEEILMDYGLEPDYVFDLLDYAMDLPEPSEPETEYPQ